MDLVLNVVGVLEGCMRIGIPCVVLLLAGDGWEFYVAFWKEMSLVGRCEMISFLINLCANGVPLCL